jgi:hypothetical protein
VTAKQAKGRTGGVTKISDPPLVCERNGLTNLSKSRWPNSKVFPTCTTLGASTEINIEIPHHIRRQFALAISALQKTTDWEGIKVYLDFLFYIVKSKDYFRNSVIQNFPDKSFNTAEES